MSNKYNSPDLNISWIEDLPDLPEAPFDYVSKLVSQRMEDFLLMPQVPRELLEKCNSTIIDVGPGEGISSMAIAQIAENSQIIGIEMDRRHLVAAWPLCNKYQNLRLAWGTILGTPSNSQIDAKVIDIPRLELPDDFCKILFTWCGMSRKDIFEPSHNWSSIVGNACILVLPKFWRQGSDSLFEADRYKLRHLSKSLQIDAISWKSTDEVPGFSQITSYSFSKRIKAYGWLLWLTGIFDPIKTTLWDTLTDRWDSSPKYQLPELLLELEILVCQK